MNWVECRIKKWKEDNIGMLDPPEYSEGISYTLNELYNLTGGMKKHEMDEHMMRLWTYKEVKDLNCSTSNIVFADIGIGSIYFSVKNNHANSPIYMNFEGEKKWEQIASNLEDFFQRSLLNQEYF